METQEEMEEHAHLEDEICIHSHACTLRDARYMHAD
jgi:hypothetical protein